MATEESDPLIVPKKVVMTPDTGSSWHNSRRLTSEQQKKAAAICTQILKIKKLLGDLNLIITLQCNA